MQLGALAGQQVVDDDLAQQRVPERVEALLVGDDELRGDRLAQRLAQLARVQRSTRRRGSAWSSRRPAASSRSSSCASSRQPLDPQHQRVAQRRRQRAAPVHPGRQQLLGEQRVALRAREQPVEQILARLGPRMSASCSASSSRVSGAARRGGRAHRARARPAAAAADGGGAARPGGRSRPPARARCTATRRGRRGTRASSGRPSAGPRSSAAGRPRRPSSSSSSSSASNRRACAVASSSASPSPRPSPGRICASASRAAGDSAASAGSPARASGRSAPTIGAYGQLALAQLDAVAADHADAVGARRALELAQQARLADAGLAGHERERRAARRRPRSTRRRAAPRARRSRPTKRALVTREDMTAVSRRPPPDRGERDPAAVTRDGDTR